MAAKLQKKNTKTTKKTLFHIHEKLQITYDI